MTPLYSGSDEQINYRLGLKQAGCVSDAQLDYHADARERPLRWIGEGLPAFGLLDQGVVAGAELTPEQYDMARAMVRGFHPGTGEQLVVGKVAVPPAAKVSSVPLVKAVEAEAHRRGVEPEALFTGTKNRAAYATAAREVARHPGQAAIKVTDAERLARAAGLAPDQVWEPTVLADARDALFETVPVLDERGRHQFTRDGRLKTRQVERRVSVGIHAFDVGIGVPKWASTLLALGPAELVDRIENIYGEATTATFAWVEGRTSYVRIGTEGRGQQARFAPSSGMSGWVMTHRAARPVGERPVGDPHWHVHITVPNLAQGPDGQWRGIAAGGRDLMRHTHAIDAVTQAGIRRELRAEYGVEFVRDPRTGQWALAHVPDDAITLFSKRHDQVVAALRDLGYDGNAAVSARRARWLTRDSRSEKTETTAAADTTLRAYWREEAVAAGLDPDAWMPRVLAAYHAGHTRVEPAANAAAADRFGVTVDELIDILTDPEQGLTAHQRRFTHLDAVVAVAEAVPFGATIPEIEQLTATVLAHPSFLALQGPDAQTGGVQLAGAQRMESGQVFTTADVPAIERRILDALATSRPEQQRAVVDPATVAMAAGVAEAAQGFPLSAEQRHVLHAVTTGGRQFEAVEGPPGTGKTATMRAARLAWEAQGCVVAGGATAAMAAQNLAAESGIESRTVAQWRWRILNRHGLAGVDVLVLDEANLTSDRDRVVLYEEALRTGTKIVEVGDPKQLRGVGLGSMFGYLHAYLDGPRLTENRRQLLEDERRALDAFRTGAHLDALRTWERLGGVVATETADEAIAAMVSTWMTARAGAPDAHTEARGVLMLAATNSQVHRLNTTAQAVRRAEGELGESRTFRTATGEQVEFHVGDQVMLRRNDRRGDQVDGDPVLNGYRGVVTAVTEQGVEVAWLAPGEPLASDPHTTLCPPAYIADGGLDLGYALTAHKAEGLTVNAGWDRPDGSRNNGTVLTYGPGQDNPGLYVSLSRDRGQAMLFASRQELEGDREHALYGIPRDQAELTDRVLTALADHATATATTANDRPVLVDLGHARPIEHLRDDQTGEMSREPVPQPRTPAQPPTRSAAADPPPSPPLDVSPEATWARMARWRAEHDRDLATGVTDEQRHQWRNVVRREFDARLRHDPEAQDAARRDRRELAAQLGPDRVNALRREANERLHERRQAWLADRRQRPQQGQRDEREQVIAQWRARAHSTLTDAQLDRAIARADRARTEHLADAEQARRDLADREPAVADGRGPRVTALDKEMAELRQAAEQARQAERIEHRWHDTVDIAVTAAGTASDTTHAADRAPWYRPGLRDRLHAEAADLNARSEQARAEAAELARQTAELQQRLGGRDVWRQAPARAEQAEATYQQNRQRAQDTDHAELRQLRDRVPDQAASATEAEIRRDELLDERRLRTAMPEPQRTIETGLRSEWAQQQHAEQAAQQQRQTQRAHELDWDYRHRTIGRGIDPGGPSLGR